MGNGPSILCSNCKKREKSHLHFTFYYQLSQTTLDSISKLININFSLSSPSKMCLKDIIMGSFSHFHDGVQLKALPSILEVFLKYLSYCRSKAFHDDGYDKINELSNYKGNFFFRINDLSDTVTKFGFKETILKTWNFLLKNNGNLNIQFNCTQNNS